MNTSLLTTTTRPLGQQLLRWILLSFITTTIVYCLLFLLQWLLLPGLLTWGLHIELFLFFFTVSLTGISRRRMKNVALTRQLIDLMAKTLTQPDASTQQQLQQLSTTTQLQLGFAVLIHRITNLLVKLLLVILLIHTLLLTLLANS
ncbi:MAG: hypothetical protein Q4C03_01280 [bacterium]|nr:hypothetical protein [bacterium]